MPLNPPLPPKSPQQRAGATVRTVLSRGGVILYLGLSLLFGAILTADAEINTALVGTYLLGGAVVYFATKVR